MSARELVQLDARTGAIKKQVDVGGSPYSSVFDRSGILWLREGSGQNRLIRVDVTKPGLDNAYFGPGRAVEYARLKSGAELGHRVGLVVNAGHGINYVNIAEVRTLPHLHELNIGHSIVSRALFSGVGSAVREMKRLMRGEGQSA